MSKKKKLPIISIYENGRIEFLIPQETVPGLLIEMALRLKKIEGKEEAVRQFKPVKDSTILSPHTERPMKLMAVVKSHGDNGKDKK